jgi:integrase
MITAASKPLAVFCRLAALTGARRGQLCGLRWSDVDLDAATIRWTRSLAKMPGGTIDKETKTGAHWPVSLDQATVELLRAHRRRCLETAWPPAPPCPRMLTSSLVTRSASSRGTRMARHSASHRLHHMRSEQVKPVLRRPLAQLARH